MKCKKQHRDSARGGDNHRVLVSRLEGDSRRVEFETKDAETMQRIAQLGIMYFVRRSVELLRPLCM